MKFTKLLFLAPLLLAACSETNTYVTPEDYYTALNSSTLPRAEAVHGDALPGRTADGSVVDATIHTASSKVQVYNVAGAGPKAMIVDGKTPSVYDVGSVGQFNSSAPQLGVVYGTFADTKTNHSFAGNVNLLAASGAKLSPREGAFLGSLNWQGVNVGYGYVAASGTSAPTKVTGNNGSIKLGASGAWSATMGDVALNGQLTGTNTSGTATLGNMKGTFDGVDGVMISGGKISQISGGAFSGTNGAQDSFAGGWYVNQ